MNRTTLFLGWTLLTIPLAWAADTRSYHAGLKEAGEIAADLSKALDKKLLGTFRAQPLSIVTNSTPFLRITEENATAGSRKVGVIVASTGFIDLINRVAHAKALDRTKKGYFNRYIHSWPEGGDASVAPALPGIADATCWEEEVLEHQTTYYSQMLGVAFGIKLANYYLGQFAKYSPRLATTTGQPQALNKFLTASEWEAAVAAGTRNALDCAYGVDGIIALFECVENMDKRPEWTTFFAPDPSVMKVSKLKKELTKIERSFFGG